MHRSLFPTFLLLLASCGSPRLVNAPLETDAKPVCAPPDACHAAEFDQVDNECIAYPVADGTSCGAANQCLIGASCLAGACVGQTRSCDDDDICTADACDPSQGCVHVASTSMCPLPPDACHVATCDPESGCGIADAPDWTPCGSMSCTEAHVCFSGSCLAVTPPDGMRCGEPTPCSAAPTCESGICVPLDGGPLPLAWSYAPPSGAWVISLGPADARGNVYWLERVYTPPDSFTHVVVSATRDGQIRFRVPIVPSGSPASTPALIAGNTLVVIMESSRVEGSGGLEAISTEDGGELWSNDLRTTSIIGANEAFDAHPAVYDGAGSLFMAIDVRGTPYQCPSRDRGMMLDVDLETGAVKRTATVLDQGTWSWRTPVLRSAGGELLGAVHVDTCSGACGFLLAGLSPDLSTFDFHIDAGCDIDEVVATTGAVMLTAGFDATRVRSAGDGHVLGSFQSPVGSSYGPWDGQYVLSSTTAYALAQPHSSQATTEITAFSIPEGRDSWRRSLRDFAQGLLLTNHKTLLTTTAPDDGGFESLVETLPDGGAGFSCLLDPTDAYWGGTEQVLLNGRWIKLANDGGAVIRAYALPGYDIADGGWVAPGGNMERNGYVP